MEWRVDILEKLPAFKKLPLDTRKYLLGLAAGKTQREAAVGLKVNRTRVLKSLKVKKALWDMEQAHAADQAAERETIQRPTPAPAPQKTACDKCGYEFKPTDHWKPRHINQYALCFGCHAAWINQGGADGYVDPLGRPRPKPKEDPKMADAFEVKIPPGPATDRRFAKDGLGTVIVADSPDPDSVKNADPFAVDHGTHSVAGGLNMESERAALIARIEAQRNSRAGDRRYTPDVGGNVAIADANPDDYVVRPRQPRKGAEL